MGMILKPLLRDSFKAVFSNLSENFAILTFIKKKVDFLTKDNRDAQYYRGFDKVEMMAIISVEKFSLKNKEELKKSRVSYVECIEFLKAKLIFFFFLKFFGRTSLKS